MEIRVRAWEASHKVIKAFIIDYITKQYRSRERIQDTSFLNKIVSYLVKIKQEKTVLTEFKNSEGPTVLQALINESQLDSTRLQK